MGAPRLRVKKMDDNKTNVSENAQEASQATEPTPAAAPGSPDAAFAPQAEPEGGISFGGGADNPYIKQFAASPKYSRTLDEIEEDEQSAAGGVTDEMRERYRASAKRRMAEGEADPVRSAPVSPRQQPASGWMIGGKVVLVDPLDDELPGAPAPQSFQTGDPLVYPEPEKDAAVYPPQPGEAAPVSGEAPAAPYVPEGAGYTVPFTGLQRLISTKKAFTVFTLITGILNILWDFLYFVTVANRELVMGATESSLRSQGQTSYTITFESPLIGLLKVVMYLLPVLAVVWAILFKRADSQKYFYNKKTVIVMLCLIALAMFLTVIDLTALHLLG